MIAALKKTQPATTHLEEIVEPPGGGVGAHGADGVAELRKARAEAVALDPLRLALGHLHPLAPVTPQRQPHLEPAQHVLDGHAAISALRSRKESGRERNTRKHTGGARVNE